MDKSHNTSGVAIIGMSCIFPQAPGLLAYWQNICNSVDAISDPLPAWDAERYLASGRINTARGGYLKDDYRFDPKSFGIMPNSVDGGEPDQFLALRVASEALADAGYLGAEYDHRDTGIILGHSTYLHRGQANLIQHQIVLDQTVELISSLLPNVMPKQQAAVRDYLQQRLPQFNADVAPSLVPNVMTGRVANRLNLRGPNFLVDAACSSSLLALDAAMNELDSGRSQMMLAGGVNASLPAEVNVIFTQLGALSDSGRVRPFAAGTDGTLLGEGLGVVVLKRYADAIEAGDRIYAVLKGVGQASDGKGQGLLAPSIQGEALAISRAYVNSGVDPASVGLIEAHGTGIPLGDQTEIAALREVFGERKTDIGQVALGSIKSMISHCIPAAGIAGVIKASLALHHRVLPPSICEAVNPELNISDTPFYINNETRPWIHLSDEPRRAGVNAFGFGGVNAHAVLEEAPPQANGAYEFSPWSDELLVFAADSKPGLEDQLQHLNSYIANNPAAPLSAVAADLVLSAGAGAHRLALVASDITELQKKVAQAIRRLKTVDDCSWQTRNGIHYAGEAIEGKLAFMFPGEGSQYLNMFADLALHFPEVRHWFEFWGRLYQGDADEQRTDILFPPPTELTDTRKAAFSSYLHQMDIGSEAVFVASQAMHSLLRSFGVRADAMVGHSTGESSALVAASAIPGGSFEEIGIAIRALNDVYRAMAADSDIVSGSLLSVGVISREIIEQHIAEVDTGILFAMENCHNQSVLFGPAESIEELRGRLGRIGAICIPLPFDRGYHTPYFENISESFLEYYKRIGLRPPKTTLYSCATAELFPDDIETCIALAARQWSRKVRFTETVEHMHRDGVRLFVEVGPSANLTSFVNDILADREYVGIATNVRKRRGLQQLLNVLGLLFVQRQDVNLARLYRDRRMDKIDLSVPFEQQRPDAGMLLTNTMPVVRLDSREKIELGALLQTDALSTALPTELNPGAPTEGAFAQGSDAAEPNEADTVMAAYFELMQDYLAKQAVLMSHLTESEGEEEEKQPSSNDQSNSMDMPFLDTIHEHSDTHLIASSYLALDSDLFLRDHVLSGPVSDCDPDLMGLACIPLMVSIEIIAEACALLANSWQLGAISDVKAMNWIALDAGNVNLEVRARWEDSTQQIVFGELLNQGQVVVSAYFEFSDNYRLPYSPELRDHHVLNWADDDLYDIGMFHGPIFQSVRSIAGWSEDGIDASLSDVSLQNFFTAGQRPTFLMNPVLLDALGQIAAYWIAQQVGTDFNCFPASIERIELYSDCVDDLDGLTVKARQQPVDSSEGGIESKRVWDFECLTAEGEVLVRTAGLVNSFYPVPNRFYQVRRDPLNGWLGAPVDSDAEVFVWRLPYLEQAFCTRSSGIFLRILAQLMLGETERDEWSRLPNDPVLLRNWFHERACVKEAMRYWIWQQSEQLLYPADIEVMQDEGGQFFTTGVWEEISVDVPAIALHHTDDACIATLIEIDEHKLATHGHEQQDYSDQII